MTTLVLVHGLFGHLNIPEVLVAFGEVETSAPDLIGYGRYADEDLSQLLLDDQANHVISHIEANHSGKVHLLGHSVGGAVCALVTSLRPDLIASFISVEGNFTLKDAFWSSQIAEQTPEEVEQIIDGYRADPEAWMNAAVANSTELTSRFANDWLNNQPPSTIQAQARAVVAATSAESYLRDLRQIMESEIPVHLIAGSRSAKGWDTPEWAAKLCSTRINIAGTGHLMMLEAPTTFAKAVLYGMGSS